MISALPVRIIEEYHDWEPAVRVTPTVRRLLATIPVQYLRGLGHVVLTNFSGQNRARRRSATKARKRKVPLAGCGGLYHEVWKSQPAWIEIFVDNLPSREHRFAWRFPPLRDLAVARILYHELGHHLHVTRSLEFKEAEDVAESWQRQLTNLYFSQRHSFMTALGLWPIAFRIDLWLWRLQRRRGRDDEAAGETPAT